MLFSFEIKEDKIISFIPKINNSSSFIPSFFYFFFFSSRDGILSGKFVPRYKKRHKLWTFPGQKCWI